MNNCCIMKKGHRVQLKRSNKIGGFLWSKKNEWFRLNYKWKTPYTCDLPLHIRGYRGEQNLDYELGFLPSSFLIFQDLRLPLYERTFQIDTLILTPHMAVIIETKNIYGTLFFNSTSKQVIRTFENTTEEFPAPLLQAKKK